MDSIPPPQEPAKPLLTLASEYASRIDVIDTNVGKAIRATMPIAKGTHLYPFSGKILDTPNMHTVQLDEKRHIFCEGGPEFTAHSCDPNAYFMFVGDAVTLVSIRDIKRHELVSFNYCTTEWDMSEKFPCACKAEHCFGWIKGFSHLNDKQKQLIAPHLSPYIKSKMAEAAPVAALPTPVMAADSKSGSVHYTAGTPSTPPRTPSPQPRSLSLATPTSPEMAPSLSTEVSSTALSALANEIRARIEIVETSVGIGKAIQTTTFIPKGTHLYPCMGTIMDQPDMWTVQLDSKRHIMCLGGPAFTAHSCDPNAYFQFGSDSMTLVAIKDIQPLELVTFNYCTTEWHMSAPFKCICKSPNCLGDVKGISHVTNPKHLAMMLPYLSPYIRARCVEAHMITPNDAKVMFANEQKSRPASPPHTPTTQTSSSPVSPSQDDKRSASPTSSVIVAPVPLTAMVPTATSLVFAVPAGATVPSNLYGATAAPYANVSIINNSGVAVVAGADAAICGHMD